MKKGVLVLLFLFSIVLTGCFGSSEKTYVCTMNSESDMNVKIVATLDSNDKVSSIDIQNIFKTEEEAKSNYSDYQKYYKDSVELDGKTIIIKKAEDPSLITSGAYSKFIGLSKDEFKENLPNYTCE
jgi:predicted component of type VI protein secretion system